LGPGLRIYFANVNQAIVLLLGGSDKGSQQRAIKAARDRLKDFKKRTK
jgi:putative addiction module killer protein